MSDSEEQKRGRGEEEEAGSDEEASPQHQKKAQQSPAQKKALPKPSNPMPRGSTARDPKADAMIAQAESKMTGNFLSKWFSGASRFEEAADLFTKAANIYKVQKNWDAAAEAYCKAADSYLRTDGAHEAANSFVQASICYKKSSTPDAIRTLTQAIELYSDAGRFSLAAKHQKEVAEIYEKEGDVDNAMSSYQRAADMYEGENAKSSAKPCLLKVAAFAADLQDYDKAVEIFEQLADENQEGLGKWNIKEYLLKAGLCKLASGDLVAVRQSIERYKDKYTTFPRDRECKFLEDLTNACENYDTEAFTDIVFQFDSLTKLDDWKTNILLKIKTSIQGEFGENKELL